MLCGPAANRTGLYHFNGERSALRDGRREANDTGVRSVRLLDVLLPGITAPGVEPDFLPVMFDRFTRSDVSRSRHSGGSGLGLSIARAICESHGGTLTASIPQEGNGLLFQVKLPV